MIDLCLGSQSVILSSIEKMYREEGITQEAACMSDLGRANAAGIKGGDNHPRHICREHLHTWCIWETSVTIWRHLEACGRDQGHIWPARHLENIWEPHQSKEDIITYLRRPGPRLIHGGPWRTASQDQTGQALDPVLALAVPPLSGRAQARPSPACIC